MQRTRCPQKKRASNWTCNNEVESLMRQAAIKGKVEPFIFELGVGVNKLEIIRKDDSI
jgi:hypothetical protein